MDYRRHRGRGADHRPGCRRAGKESLKRVFFLALLAATLAHAQIWGPPAGAQPTYSLVYTGRLFGYYRYPDIQTSDDHGCPDPASTPLPPQVKLYQDQLQTMPSTGRLLVAMGDNFAPDLLARKLQNNLPATGHTGELVSKEMFSPSAPGDGWRAAAEPVAAGKVPSDNVACFLRLMGFHAIVPGQQDFYYGPERLRQIARFLAEPGTRGYRSVQMLASNLVIRTTRRNPPAPVPNDALPLARQRALDADSPIKFDLPTAVYPWFAGISLSGKAQRLAIYDCPASPTDPRDFLLPFDEQTNCRRLSVSSPESQRFRLLAPEAPSPQFIARYYTLDPGSNHALCATYQQGADVKTHCQLFSVQYPFLQYNPALSGTTPAPYYLPADPNGPAIFGVLDPSLISYVGELSDVWRNTDPRFDTSAQITDPVEAMRQMLALCDADAACHGRRRVLLAQMPYYRAAELANKLKGFDIVIAQSDQEHASAVEATTRLNPEPFVLSPGVAFDSRRNNVLSTNLRQASLYVIADNKRSLSNAIHDVTLAAPALEPCRACALDAAIAHAVSLPASRNRAVEYEDLALSSMQRFCASDIALLQHRDVFAGFEKAMRLWPPGFRATPQQMLDEALWKGDFAFCVPVKGATLKTILKESAAFDQQDQDNLSIEVEKGRGLSTLGIQNDPASGAPLIRGLPIEVNRLYGVAMTDYLAFGNTGYPELSTEAIQPVIRIVSLKGLNRLTGLACERLPSDFTEGSCQSDEISAADYFAAIQQHPFDTGRGLTSWLELRRWITHPLQRQPNVTTFVAEKTAMPENVVERRGLWYFTLQNVSLGYNLNFIRGSDRTVPGSFAGNNSFSQLSTPESSQVNLWVRARGGYSFPRFVDFFSSAELRYSRLAVRNSAANGNFGDYQLTLGNNLLRAETGLTTKPLTQRIPIRFLLSEDLLTQAATPFQQFSVPLACANGLPCTGGQNILQIFNLPRNYLVLTRLGARIQNERSWIEAGREYGANVDTPSGYSLQDISSSVPFECDLAKGLTLSNCIGIDPLFTNQSTVITHLHTQSIAGWFANFHVTVPLFHNRLQLLTDSYGELFDRRNDDTGYNTRFYEDFTVALNVPLWGNLSFAPQVETFYYQNKIVPEQIAAVNHYVFVTTTVTLQYGFDWHRGVGLLRALRFPNGVSTSTSGTLPRP